MNKNVHHPDHYTHGERETIDKIRDITGDLGFRAYLKGNIIKYLDREQYKGNAVEDLQKAAWYLDKLISVTMELEVEHKSHDRILSILQNSLRDQAAEV